MYCFAWFFCFLRNKTCDFIWDSWAVFLILPSKFAIGTKQTISSLTAEPFFWYYQANAQSLNFFSVQLQSLVFWLFNLTRVWSLFFLQFTTWRFLIWIVRPQERYKFAFSLFELHCNSATFRFFLNFWRNEIYSYVIIFITAKFFQQLWIILIQNVCLYLKNEKRQNFFTSLNLINWACKINWEAKTSCFCVWVLMLSEGFSFLLTSKLSLPLSLWLT